MLHTFYFSATGTTKANVEALAVALGENTHQHDLTVRPREIIVEGSDDIVLIASPVYGGRVPAVAAERFAQVKGKGQRAIAMVVYGNRDYDDALLELCDIAKEQGFKVVAAGAFLGEHCIFPKVATNRPDGADIAKLADFAAVIKESLAAGVELDFGKVKGTRPYKKISAVPLHPKVDKSHCNGCGTCARECPVGAIPHEKPQVTDGSKCITCCRCISVCPQEARRFGGFIYKIAGWKFTKDNARRIEPEWFV